jgi:diguanylate cyclase (GGDEF)-like protein/PAS domain S-box-containing protein
MVNKDTSLQDPDALRKHLDSIITPVAYLDTEFNFILVNLAYAKAGDREPGFFAGKNHFDLYPNAENQTIFQKVVDSGNPYRCNARPFEYADHPERGLTYWDWELSPIRDDSDTIQGLVLSLIDVTERVIAQEELSSNLLDQEIMASILHLSLQPVTFEEILRQALVLALQRTDLGLAPKGVIFLLDPESGELEMTVRHGLPDTIVSSCARIRRGQCICGMALEQEKLIFTSCVDEHHHVTYPGMSPHGHYCVPVKSQGEILGVLNLYVPHGHKSNRSEVQFVTAIADTLAGVILRERTSTALKESEQRFRAITDTARDAIITIDTSGKIVSWNRGAESIFGYAHDEIIGQPLTIIMPVRYRKLHEEAVEHWSKSGTTRHSGTPMEIFGLCKDGTEIALEILLSNWNIEDRSHVTGIVRDISKRKDAEARLRQAEAVFDNAMEGIIVTDATSNILSVNHAITEITGYCEEELIGQSPRIWKSDRHDDFFFRSMWLELAQTGEWRGEIWNRHKNGGPFPCWQTIRAIKDDAGEITHYISIMSDISAVKASQEKAEYLAHHDPLTGLPNRILFHARLEHALTIAQRETHMAAILFMDLDRFKHINDSLGHAVGDSVLQEVAKRLQHAVREEDTVARIGGDEFPILLEHINDPAEATIVADKLLLAFSEPLDVPPHRLHLSPSIGISLYPADAGDYATLLRNADTAMYRAKAKGRNTYQFYSASFTEEAEKRVELETRLRHAIKHKEFTLFYQPQYDILTGRLTGAEALIRWQPPDSDMISPDHFIPLAEETGLILEIGRWVLHTACLQMREWRHIGLEIDQVSVNIAGKQLQHGAFMEEIELILRETGCSPEWLEIEITEGFIMQRTEQAISYLSTLRDMGIGVAIDDFGTGYSSLSYLKRLPLTKLKIDKSFIMDIPDDADDLAISKAIIALGQSLQLKVIAEGVETGEQRSFLLTEGCDEAQGYLFSRPVPAAELTKILQLQ